MARVGVIRFIGEEASWQQEQHVLAPKGKEEPGTPDGKRGVRRSWRKQGGRAALEVTEAALQLHQGAWILALGQGKQWGVLPSVLRKSFHPTPTGSGQPFCYHAACQPAVLVGV